MSVGQRGGSLGGPNPPLQFHALICEGLEREHSYSVHLFTKPIGAPVSILVEVGRRGVSGGPNPPFSVPRAYMRRTRHRSLILSILINYTYRNAHIDFGARRSKKGVSGGTQPPFSVPRANMQRTWDRTLILSIPIYFTYRSTCIDFGGCRSKGGLWGRPTPPPHFFGFTR